MAQNSTSSISKPTANGKKYLQLTDNILLEYTYVLDRFVSGDIDDDRIETDADGNFIGTYGKSDVNTYVMHRSGYTKEVYFMNDNSSYLSTNNIEANSILPIKKDVSQWVEIKTNPAGDYYDRYDDKWRIGMYSTPGTTEYIPYDILRIYFQSGYHSEYDGFVLNAYTKNRANTYVNLLSVIINNNDDRKLVTEPMWFADKIYTEYIEYRIPSTAYLSSDCTGGLTPSMRDSTANHWSDYKRGKPDDAAPGANTLPSFLTRNYSGNDNGTVYGFYANPAIGVDLHAIVGYTMKHDFKVYKTRMIVSTMMPNRDAYDKLFACVRNATDGDYFSIYGYYENDPEHPIYDENSLFEYLRRFSSDQTTGDPGFSIVHIISVTEKWTDGSNSNDVHTTVQPPITYIQTWDNIREIYEDVGQLGLSPVIKFRPVLTHTSDLDSANISYTLRLISNKDGTSIIKGGTCEITNARRFGPHMVSANIYSNDVHVYNRIEAAPTLNITEVVSPIGAPKTTGAATPTIQVNKYVTSSFIDRRNIRVSVSPVKIENIE